MMAEIIGYTMINGKVYHNHEYKAEVQTQEDIEEHRRRLAMDGFDIFFSIRQPIGSKLHP